LPEGHNDGEPVELDQFNCVLQVIERWFKEFNIGDESLQVFLIFVEVGISGIGPFTDRLMNIVMINHFLLSFHLLRSRTY
jgi:hypothetical protein